jgi:Domain of Unknown Function with PDB structure (DUF3857)
VVNDGAVLQTGAAEMVRCTPVPRWVRHDPVASQTSAAEDASANGICRVLQDIQIDLSGAEFGWHCRSSQRVLSRTGAERAAHFVVEFDPSYERLEVHFIRIVRGQDSIEHARPGALQVFRRETSLERLTLNGRLTASLLIPDVRIDDVVEISFTLFGSNPALRGKCAAWVIFDAFNPWLEFRCRMLRPSSRTIAIKKLNDPPEPETDLNGGIEDSRWRIAGQKRREIEEFVPPWVFVSPALQFSEFASWNEVACLFAPLYDGAAIPDVLVKEIDRVAAAHRDPADRAVEWLRFVQQALRYFALSFGEGGLVPRPLDAVWSSRFGDCKDAARLYVAGARRLGLDACAALCSTALGQGINEFVPSSNLFNHCIVRLRLNGSSYWLDPTLREQSGTVETVFQPHAGWALPLTSDTMQLESMGEARPLHYLNCEDEVCFGPAVRSPAVFRRKLEFCSWAAETVRERIANQGGAAYAKDLLNEVQAFWPSLVETTPIEISDDQKKNCLTVKLTYEIRNCWKLMREPKLLAFETVDTLVAGELQPLKGMERTTPIMLGRPRKTTHSVRMTMPCEWHGEGWVSNIEVSGMRYSSRLAIGGQFIRFFRELLINAWSIPAQQADEYRMTTDIIRENVLSIGAREAEGKIKPPTSPAGQTDFWAIFWLVCVLVIIGGVLLMALQ